MNEKNKIKIFGFVIFGILLMVSNITIVSSLSIFEYKNSDSIYKANPPLAVDLTCSDSRNKIPAKITATTIFVVKITNTGSLLDRYDVIAGAGTDVNCFVNAKGMDVISLKPGESEDIIITIELCYNNGNVPDYCINIDLEAMSKTNNCIFDNVILYVDPINNDNDQPNPPEVIGKNVGKINEEHEYEFYLTDSDQDNLKELLISWGDGKIETVLPGSKTGWLSGSRYKVKHSWENHGKYEIKSYVMDDNEFWSKMDLTIVNMPKEKNIYNSIENLLFERYPIIFNLFFNIINS